MESIEVPGTESEFTRLPGLYRRWELETVLAPGTAFHLEEAGASSDGTPLFAIYRRERSTPNDQKE